MHSLVRRLRIAAVPAACCALLLGACGDDEETRSSVPAPPPAPRAEDFPAPGGRTLSQIGRELGPGPVLAPSVSLLEPGKNRFGFALFDAERRQLGAVPAAVYVAPKTGGKVAGPYPARFESLAVEPEFASESTTADPDSARGVFVADVDLPKAGDYEILGVLKTDQGFLATQTVYPSGAAFNVPADGPVPEVGEPAPRISTPTVESVGGAVEQIDTRVPPTSQHEVDFADALGKRPIVISFATPALCQSRVCGPVVDVAEQVKSDHEGDAAFIHMEIYNENAIEKGFREQVLAWKLPTEPWVFTVDRSGKVAARLEGAYSARELEAALEAATRG